MKKLSIILITLLICGISIGANAAKVENYSTTINMFRKSPTVQKFFNNAYGYAIFPTIGKAGYVVGGSYGKGQVYRKGKVVGKTSVIEGSIGFQIGGEVFSEIIFFQNRDAYQKFTSGNFEFDATAQAVAITAGAQAQVGTKGASTGANIGSDKSIQANPGYFNGMATFVQSQGGFMYELSIGGQKFTFSRL
jgi:lipid-binding SYLF domain-containing protein